LQLAGSTGFAGHRLEMPETIPHNASFPDIYEAFSSRGCSTLVVTADNRPLGYLTCDGFLSLIDPVTRDTYRPAASPADQVAHLAVPSISSLATAESAPA
jgi:hypothetical protein